jgi:glycosyltransferase involved in cell wall biosynthesis
MQRIVVESTVCIGNRTAVYEIARELGKIAGYRSRYRYWFLFTRKFINFADAPRASVICKVLWRIMMRWSSLKFLWRRPRYHHSIIFTDPLFARVSPLRDGDHVIIHDLGPILHPELYNPGTGTAYREAYQRLLEHEVNFVFVSQYAKESFVNTFSPGASFRSTVIPNFYVIKRAVNIVAQNHNKTLFLCTGALERRKNYPRIIDAFVESGLAQQDYHLAIVGPRGNASPDILAKVERAPNVRYFGFVQPTELVRLYEQARALIFPSLFEGFGVPAIEAPAMGVLPLISSIPPLLEVTGNSAVVVDPYSIRKIAHGMKAIAAMSSLEYSSRLMAIRKHQERFSLVNYHARWRQHLELTPDNQGCQFSGSEPDTHNGTLALSADRV